VYFHGEIEVRKRVGAFGGVPFEEFSFLFFESAMMFRSPRVKKALDASLLCFDFGGWEILVGIRVGEVVPKGEFDILVEFDDGWAEVLIASDDKEEFLQAKRGKGETLVA
jgi:hypothetical protein